MNSVIVSKSVRLAPVLLPFFRGDQLYMHPIDLANPKLPSNLSHWEQLLAKMVENSPVHRGKAFLTIDQKFVRGGDSHRRGGAHVDGNYTLGKGWDDRRPSWLTGDDGPILPTEKHAELFCSPTGGMLIASDVAACRVWNGIFEGVPGQGGNCEHLRSILDTADSYIMQANHIYWTNSTCIHESIPFMESAKRSLIRLTLPSYSPSLLN